jgi:protein-disulfide isomerase
MSEKENIPNELIEETELPEDGGTLQFRRSNLYAALLPLAFVTGLAAGYIFWGRSPEVPIQVVQVDPAPPGQIDQAAAPAEQIDQAPAPPDLRAQQGQIRLEIDEDDDPVIGAADAPITIIEFSDFRCPYCKRFRSDTFDQLFEAYPDQIRFIYRDFPVVGGFEAAIASECADDQGAYWPYHDLLFSDGYAELNREAYLGYAEELELDLEAFTSCLDDQQFADEVESDARYAAGLGVTGTPTFFINGIPIVGAQPFEVFAQIIDAELGG